MSHNANRDRTDRRVKVATSQRPVCRPCYVSERSISISPTPADTKSVAGAWVAMTPIHTMGAPIGPHLTFDCGPFLAMPSSCPPPPPDEGVTPLWPPKIKTHLRHCWSTVIRRLVFEVNIFIWFCYQWAYLGGGGLRGMPPPIHTMSPHLTFDCAPFCDASCPPPPPPPPDDCLASPK